MAVNKVELGNETLIDLTSDTVQADTLLNGATAHAANGEQIVGKVNGVIYFENPQDYYNLSEEERKAINELVILNEDGEPLDASLITYGNSNVGAELQRLDSETTDLNNFKNNMSDAWNNSTNYEVGQYCIYNNILWKCLVQNIGQTPAEGTYWTNVTIGSEFNVVKNDIDTLNSNLKNVLVWARINKQAAIGSVSVSIPSWAKEVQVSIDVNNEFRYTSIYPITSLEDNSLICVVGSSFYKYGSAEEISYASVNISKTSVNMRNVILNGVDVKSKSYMTIYCR